MKIALGADAAGKPLLDVIAAHLKTKKDVTVVDLSEPGYYAGVADRVASSINSGSRAGPSSDPRRNMRSLKAARSSRKSSCSGWGSPRLASFG